MRKKKFGVVPLDKFKEYMFLLEQEKIGGGVTLFDVLQDHLRISKQKINRHYSQNSAIYAFWVSKYELEKYRMERFRRQAEKRWATHYIMVKSNLPGRVSETEIKARLTKSKQIEDDQEKLELLVYKVGLLKAIVDVMKLRQENVVNLGASLRKELGMHDHSTDRRERLRERMRAGK